jgi:hypothetical protein
MPAMVRLDDHPAARDPVMELLELCDLIANPRVDRRGRLDVTK